MSSAINHAKRSHHSHARHYSAAGLRKITSMHQQARRGLKLLRPGFFKPRRREKKAKQSA